MTSWALNLLYCGLIAMFSPLLLFRSLWQGKYRQGWGQRFLGRVEERTSTGPAIWLHAVSVGEVLILRTLIPPLRERVPGCEIWISTTTHTGYAVAKEKYPDCKLIYFPLDFTWASKVMLSFRLALTGFADKVVELGMPRFHCFTSAVTSGVPRPVVRS